MIQSLAADRRSYSRYEPAAATITARIRHTYAVTTPVSLQLWRWRAEAWSLVATQDLSLLAATPAQTDTFRLESLVDLHGLSAVPAGRYRLAIGAVYSAPFDVRLITPATLREHYLRGLPLQSRTLQLTGQTLPVTVVALSETWARGTHALVFTLAGRTLALAGGLPVAVPAGDGPHTVTLVDDRDSNYVTLEVDGWALPTANQADTVLIDFTRVTDADLVRALDQAQADLQSVLTLDLEPTRYSTRALQAMEPSVEVDGLLEGVDMEPRGPASHIWRVMMKRKPVLAVERIHGIIASDPVLTVPQPWIVLHEKGGYVDLVARVGEGPVWAFTGSRWMPLLLGSMPVPNFWHVRMIAGLRDLHDGPGATARQALGYLAVLNLLGFTGLGITGGRAGFSTGRDGISESHNFNTGGPFAPLVEEYRGWLQQTLPRLQRQLQGFRMVTLQ